MNAQEQELYNQVRKNCWDNALHCFGHNYIFKKRIKFYNRINKSLKFSSIILPFLIGTVAYSYSSDDMELLKFMIKITVPLTIIQAVISLYAIIKDWDGELNYSIDAANNYNSLSEGFKKQGQTPPTTYTELRHEFDLLNSQYNSRSQRDASYSVSEKEKRKGMKAGLREFQRECAGCNVKPLSMKNTNCDVCGNFGLLNI